MFREICRGGRRAIGYRDRLKTAAQSIDDNDTHLRKPKRLLTDVIPGTAFRVSCASWAFAVSPVNPAVANAVAVTSQEVPPIPWVDSVLILFAHGSHSLCQADTARLLIVMFVVLS